MNSLIENVHQIRQGYSLGYVETNIICYADDNLALGFFAVGQFAVRNEKKNLT